MGKYFKNIFVGIKSNMLLLEKIWKIYKKKKIKNYP